MCPLSSSEESIEKSLKNVPIDSVLGKGFYRKSLVMEYLQITLSLTKYLVPSPLKLMAT